MARECWYHKEFVKWLDSREDGLQDKIFALTTVIEVLGPNMGRPRVDTVKDSDFSNMKELRVQYKGDPCRILFAFGPHKNAIFLLGGMKVNDRRWHKKNVPIADERSRRHLESLKGQ